MSHRLPPLNGLRAFEVTARHLSFTHAANELYLTRSAVAQQVRKLEQALELKLFHRRRNRLTLTAEGERYLPHVAKAFQTISAATEDIAPALKGRVFRLGVAPPLMKRNSRLATLLRSPHSSLRLRISKTEDLGALRDGSLDALLRVTEAPNPGYNVERLNLSHLVDEITSARLVTQPGLAGCREQRSLIQLLLR